MGMTLNRSEIGCEWSISLYCVDTEELCPVLGFTDADVERIEEAKKGVMTGCTGLVETSKGPFVIHRSLAEEVWSFWQPDDADLISYESMRRRMTTYGRWLDGD